jgi:ketosteroid isomerase-like protein
MIEPRTDRQRAIHHYVTEYGAGDYESAASIFTDDVRWIVVGAFECTGRDQYVANMTNDQVEGHPRIDVLAYIEGPDDVVVEGTATQRLAGGPEITVPFLDVFAFRGEKVREKRSYCVPPQALDIDAAPVPG